MLNSTYLAALNASAFAFGPLAGKLFYCLEFWKTAANRIVYCGIKHYKDSKSFAICKLIAKNNQKKVRQSHDCLTLHDKRFKATKLPKEVSLQNRAILLLCALPARQIYMYLQPCNVS